MIDLFKMLMNIDDTLKSVIDAHGPWVYGTLFAIIFAETGLVVLPLLPGDSLLFAAGIYTAPAKDGAAAPLNLWLLMGVLVVAAVLGDFVNYHIGKWVGPKLFRGEGVGLLGKLLNRKPLARANAFYCKYGGKAVVLGRFVPIVRTFVPFVAGAGAMNYSRFVWFNIAGAVLWVGVCVLAGHWFGNIDLVRENFEAVVIGIIVVSLIPIAVEVWMSRRQKHACASPAAAAPPPVPVTPVQSDRTSS